MRRLLSVFTLMLSFYSLYLKAEPSFPQALQTRSSSQPGWVMSLEYLEPEEFIVNQYRCVLLVGSVLSIIYIACSIWKDWTAEQPDNDININDEHSASSGS